ncbi:MAG: efflux RND transporter permease subunit, partial [Myxococcota bacterium]|nr:efflux RND transporter permease subunit [Myxococcota bacterium]
TLVPVLAARLPTPRPVEQQPLWARMSGALMAGIESVYGRLLSGSLAHPWLTTLIALLVLAGSIAASRGIGRELMPMGDEGVVSVSGKMPAGTPLESTLEVLRQAEDIVLAEVPELEDLLAVAGAGGWWSSAGANSFRLQLRLDDERLRSSEEVATALRAPMAQIPDLRPRIRAAEGFWLFRYLRGGGERLEVEIRGHDLEEADRLTAAVMRVMEEAEGVTDVRASREDGLPELRMTVERDKAQAMGLTSAAVRETVQTYVLGTEATRVLKDGEEYSVRVRLPESDRRRVDQLPDLPVVSPSGEVAYLGRLVRLDRQEGPLAIERKDQMRVVTVSAGFEGGSLSDVIERLRPELQAIPQADGFDVVIAGESEQQQGTFAQMGVGLLLALALVYMVMAAQFESLRHPLVIMGSVPFAGVGAVLALLLTGTTFNVYSYLGLIVLAGIVVNNAIVMVDLVNRLRRDEGMGRREALLVGARLRLRPILMTTLTTVLALLPVAIGVGEGGELQAPLARVVVGGLLVSTAVSLVLVPVLYQAVGGRIEASPDLAETLIEE